MQGVFKLRSLRKFLEGVFLTLTLAVTIASCNHVSGSAPKPTTDSTFIANAVEAVLYPPLTSVPEVLDLQATVINEYMIDDVFMSMTNTQLTNVATVCLKKKAVITAKDIVEEYRANQNLYDALEPYDIEEPTAQDSTGAEDSSTTVVEGQPTPVPLSTSYHYEVDTIDGKPVKVLVKEEKYESK